MWCVVRRTCWSLNQIVGVTGFASAASDRHFLLVSDKSSLNNLSENQSKGRKFSYKFKCFQGRTSPVISSAFDDEVQA